jgi:formylglycine-generating enzyme required for sulfatase activity
VEDRWEHPVIHVSWTDACAYAAWAGGRLPTEAEWETAAKAGRKDPRFPWGNEEPEARSERCCNIWQGEFPRSNTRLDGYRSTVPVDSYAPNDWGLFNMVGNTWEWCADTFKVRSLKRHARNLSRSQERFGVKTLKGGSFLCHRSYCYRYRIAARTGVPTDTSTGHVGFRIVRDEESGPIGGQG